MDCEKIEEELQTIDEVSEMMVSTANTEIESINVEEVEVEEIVAGKESSPIIKEFLDSDFGSHQEQVIKKMMAAAAIASGYKASAEEVACQADASAVSMKAAYKVSTGELDITDSAGLLIDRAAARLDTFIQDRLDMNFIGDKVADIVAMTFPPAIALKPYVKAVLKKSEPFVRKSITTGIKAVATAAKHTVRTLSNKVKLFAKALFA